MIDKLREVSPGVFLTDSRAAAEALFRDLTNGWVITTQNGLIDCIEEHLVAFHEQLKADNARLRGVLAEHQRLRMVMVDWLGVLSAYEATKVNDSGMVTALIDVVNAALQGGKE